MQVIEKVKVVPEGYNGAGMNYDGCNRRDVNRKTCNVIYGVVTLPNEPTVTGLVGRNACGCLPCGFTQPASGTPAQ